RYDVPSRRYMTDTELPKLHDSSAFSFTADIRTGSVSPVSLISLTSQWIDENNLLQTVISTHKDHMKKKFNAIYEGSGQRKTSLSNIYTKLYITEVSCDALDSEHEIAQMDTGSRSPKCEMAEIDCNDIFGGNNIRTVLTRGVAGIGKSVSVHKFIHDWAEETANQDVKFVFVLPLRELNSISDHLTLHSLLSDYFPAVREFKDFYVNNKTVFIFDGLDESRIRLDFQKCSVCDENTAQPIGVLITSLIKGDLLPNARIWITSRPAAIGPKLMTYIVRVTEIQGFNDQQRQEFFKISLGDQKMADQIISNIKGSRLLYIMCQIPLFCWILATVMRKMLDQEIPKTLTSMYSYFLLIQTAIKQQKYEEESEMQTDAQHDLMSNREWILKLSKLAFVHLEKGNLNFDQKHLTECGIDMKALHQYGLFTEVIKENVVFLKKVTYSFVHLSIQEFLAAFYVFHSYVSKDRAALRSILAVKTKSLPEPPSLDGLLKALINKALDSKNGHLDLLVCFLHGFLLESNQKVLEGLLPRTQSDPETMRKIIRNLKVMQRRNISPERCINLFRCLSEINDSSVHVEIREFLDSERSSAKYLSLAHCSGLVYMLQLSENVQEEFDLRKYNTSDEGRKRLVPAVMCCRKAMYVRLLSGCKLTEVSCEAVASALRSPSSHLRELDLSDNDIQDAGVAIISSALCSPNCRLEILRFEGCRHLSREPKVLQKLKELDLSKNFLQETGVQLLRVISAFSFHFYPLLCTADACTLTLNQCTAHPKLSCSERKVTWSSAEQSYPHHPKRFRHCVQVLCKERLTSRHYWEVDWTGSATIGVAYEAICGEDCKLGSNTASWSLDCFTKSYAANHDSKSTIVSASVRSKSGKVGVFLSHGEGTLTFYSVSSGTLTHLHTFRTRFTQPLYAGFGVSTSVTISQIKRR
uniref:Uncharacterized protein n=1 Tax=Denticeps clupeoides TaxID=299321 RepID=A0AAY3ZW19_9TELE